KAMHLPRVTLPGATFAARLRPRRVRHTLPTERRKKPRGIARFWGLGEQVMQSPVQPGTRRAVSAAVIGNVLEWYDFSVYAFVAVIIARKFFPQGDEVTALLSTFLAYVLGFVARPLGGVILGRLGDT